jgi:hypothetical protein
MLLEIIYIRLVLDAWSLALGTCRPGFLLLAAWSLRLEACRLQLGASFSPREARHNILGGEMSLVLAV